MKQLPSIASSIAIVACAAASFAAPAHADPLQDRVLAGMRASPGDRYAFRRTTVIERTGAERRTVVEAFDPRRPAAERWTLVSVDGRAPTAKETAEARKAAQGRTGGYESLAKWFGAAATRSDPAAGQALYRFARLPAGTIKINGRDLSADTEAQVLVDSDAAAPYAARIRFAFTKGMRMMLVASMKSLVVTSRYRPLADGTIVPVDADSMMTGALMGKAGQLHSVMTYADYKPVR